VADSQRYAAAQPLPELVTGALAGHQDAWNALVARLERVVWKAVNMMTFDHEIRDDAFAATWLRLAERLHTIREPEKLPGWLATTATNEVRQIVRQRGRNLPLAEPPASASRSSDVFDSVVGDDGDHASSMMLDDARREVRDAFARLDDGCRELLTVLVLADPPIPYDEASEILGRPVGALGPSRRRCLEKMKGLLPATEGDV
jgi:RNA polymerase sigma factor (sigma-70 family)